MSSLGLVCRNWPASWQTRWQAVRASDGDVFGEDGEGAHWAPDTERVIRRRIELFFGHLDRLGLIDPKKTLDHYLTDPVLRPFIEELQARVAPVTVAGYLRDIRIGLKAMQPNLDDSVIKLVAGRLKRTARPTRETVPHGIKPSDLFLAGIDRMTLVDAAIYEKEDVRAVQYGDGLAMAILASVPIRLRNLIGLKLGSSLNSVDGIYRIVLSAQETKGKRPYAGELPQALTAYVDRYIGRHRHKLLNGKTCNHLFISCYRGPMSGNAMRGRFKDATKQMLGVAITPHQARAMAATAIAIEFPEKIGIATPLLGHAKQSTTQTHYNMAGQISAGRDYNTALDEWRTEASDALRKGKIFEEGS